MFAASRQSACADYENFVLITEYYKNLTPFSKSKIWTAERTMKYMFAASRQSACADNDNTLLKDQYYKNRKP